MQKVSACVRQLRAKIIDMETGQTPKCLMTLCLAIAAHAEGKATELDCFVVKFAVIKKQLIHKVLPHTHTHDSTDYAVARCLSQGFN